jgi:hypothetical protein
VDEPGKTTEGNQIELGGGTTIKLKTQWFKRVEENGDLPIVIEDASSGHLIFEPLCLKIMQLFYSDEPG